MLIIDLPSPRSKTAASSLLSLPTSKLGCGAYFTSDCKMVARFSGEILHPQPAPGLNCVNLGISILFFGTGVEQVSSPFILFVILIFVIMATKINIKIEIRLLSLRRNLKYIGHFLFGRILNLIQKFD